jgi:hypothetical protein
MHSVFYGKSGVTAGLKATNKKRKVGSGSPKGKSTKRETDGK